LSPTSSTTSRRTSFAGASNEDEQPPLVSRALIDLTEQFASFPSAATATTNNTTSELDRMPWYFGRIERDQAE
jgi:hypothetical protein